MSCNGKTKRESYRVSLNQNIQGNPPLYGDMYPPVYPELYTEKKVSVETYCGAVVDQYGEERSEKDMAMLRQFGCR